MKEMKRKLYLSLVLLIFAAVGYAQQESQFTQFMYNQLYLNPAYAGARGMGSFTAIYRKQWAGFEGAPESKLLSFNTPLFGDRVGFGITIANHTQGIENYWNGEMAYSYHIKIDESTSLRFGLAGSMRYFGLDFSDPSVIIREDGDQSILYDRTEDKYTANFGVGAYLQVKQMYFGISVPHLFPSELGINPSPGITNIAEVASHYYLTAGTLLPISEKVQLKPAILAKYVPNSPFDLDFNLSMIFDATFTAGLSYRMGGDSSGESVDLLAMYQVNNVAIGAAYDFTLSQIKDASNGSFEVLIRYDFLKERDDMASPRFFF